MGVQRGGGTGDGFGQQGGGAGFAEQIEIIVARRTIGAHSHIDPSLPQTLDRAEAAGQFEVGFRAVDHAAVAFYQQGEVVIADLGHVHRLEARAEQAKPGEARQWPFAGLLDGLLHLECGFVHVHVDRGVQLLGDHPDFLEVLIADGVGCMRAESDLDAFVMLEVAEQFDALTNGFVGAAGTGDREIEDRNGDLRTDAAVVHALAGDFREEVHVRETADAALDLFGDCQISAVADKVFIDPLALGRPDVVFQPGHQRQIVGQATEQRHRRVAVGVDQPRRQQDIRQFTDFRGVTLQCFGARADKHDATVTDAQAVLLEHHACRFDGDQPGRQQ